MANKISVLLFAFFVFASCENATQKTYLPDWESGKKMAEADKSKCPSGLRNIYNEDAATLALRDVHEYDSLYKYTLVEIPKGLIKLYYNGLLHIYNSTTIPARDSVVSLYKIHPSRNPETHQLLAAVDGNAEWVENWENGVRLTGNPEIDRLMKKYNLQLESYYTNGALVCLSSPKAINIRAFCCLFEKINGVFYSHPNHFFGGGKEITASIKEECLELIISIGYGDCPSGCVYRHYWLFEVEYDGTVHYIKSYGDPAPPVE